MELDLTDSPIDLKAITPRELEEIFEDPFAIRFLPDVDRADGMQRGALAPLARLRVHRRARLGQRRLHIRR